MNEEEIKQVVEYAVSFVTFNAEAGMHSYPDPYADCLPHINDLLKVVTAQQAEIAALKAEVKRLTPHWSENPPILVDLK